jgi:hypothetical protein
MLRRLSLSEALLTERLTEKDGEAGECFTVFCF